MTWILTASNFNALRSRSNANKKVIDTQCTPVLFSRVFATRKSRPAFPAPLPFLPSSHSSLFFSEVCSLFFLTAVSQPFVCQSLRYSFHRDGGSHPSSPSSQKLCAIFVSCSSPLLVPKSRRINTCKSLSKQRTLVSFRMIDLQKNRGRGVLWLTNFLLPARRGGSSVPMFQRAVYVNDSHSGTLQQLRARRLLRQGPGLSVLDFSFPPSTFNFRLSTSSPVTGLSRVRRGGGAERPLPTSSRVRIVELRVEWRLFLKSKRRFR